MKPIIKQSSAEKIFRYFFGDGWQKYEAIELAIRNGANKINIFDDELYVYNRTRKIFKTFNWNADPSAYRIGSDSIAILRNGVHFYKISYHHIGNNSKRYVALRADTPNNASPVWRTDARGNLYLSTGFALNQHTGGDRTTGSRGCQTAPRSQFGEFITFVGDAFQTQIPLGVQRRAEKRFLDGIGRIPYVLVTQAQFNYIVNLDESQFDSPADLRYQMANFVNIPKIEREQPVLAINPNADQVIGELEDEQEVDNAIDTISAVVPAVNPSLASPSTLVDMPAVGENVSEPDPQIASIEQSPIQQTAENIVNVGNDNSPETEDQPFAQYIPNITKEKVLFGGGIFGTSLTWIASWWSNQPLSVQIGIGILLFLIVGGFIWLIVANRKLINQLILDAMHLKADKSKNTPVLVTEKPTQAEQLPNGFIANS